jgi:hypothetical protein
MVIGGKITVVVKIDESVSIGPAKDEKYAQG